ncbi:MAG: hypothetical protein ACK559_03805, partial [bacterium]
ELTSNPNSELNTSKADKKDSKEFSHQQQTKSVLVQEAPQVDRTNNRDTKERYLPLIERQP